MNVTIIFALSLFILAASTVIARAVGFATEDPDKMLKITIVGGIISLISLIIMLILKFMNVL